MKRVVFILLLNMLLCCFSNCEQEVKLDLQEEQRLVLLSNFSPDSLFRLSLSTTIPIKDIPNQGPVYPENAMIQLYENGTYVDDFVYHPGDEFILPFYTLNAPPKEATSYLVTATVPGYPVAQATDHVPDPIAIENLEVLTTSMEEWADSPGKFFYNIDANLKIENIEKENQFFHVRAWRRVGVRIRPVMIAPVANIGIAILHESGFLLESSEFPTESEGVDITLSFVYDSNVEIKSPVYIELRNASENYYRFHKSVGEQEFSSGNNQNVLSTEAYFIYNNIEGGIGNFSGYNMVLDSLEF